MHATTKSVAAMESFKSYWDTPGSPAEEEIQPAQQPVVVDVVAPFDGSEELDPDMLAQVDPGEDVEEEEVVVVEVSRGGA